MDLIRAQHAGALEASENARLRDQVDDLEKSLKETKTALKTADARAVQLQDGLSETKHV